MKHKETVDDYEDYSLLHKFLRQKNIILLFISAFLVALAFAVDQLGIVILVALVPLFAMLMQTTSYMEKSRYSLIYSISVNMLLTFWLTSLYPMEFLGFTKFTGLFIYFAWLILAVVLAVPLLINLLLIHTYQLTGWRYACTVASLWTIMEWLMELGDMGFPWFHLSLPLANILPLAQTASLIGSLGLSFLVIFINVSLAQYIIAVFDSNKTEKDLSNLLQSAKQHLLLAISIVAIMIGYGFYQLNQPITSSAAYQAALIQGNINPTSKWEEGAEWKHYEWHRDQTLQAIHQGAKIIVWPETSLAFPLNEYPGMMHELEDIAKSNSVIIIAGSFYREQTIKTSDSMMDTSYLFNSLYFFPGNQMYQKQQLVPIGEYMPQWMMTMLPLLREFQLANQLNAASQSVLLTQNTLKIGGLICFESIFPHLTLNHVQDGANLLLIASNDAWYQNSAEITQHKNHAILRSIESNRYLLRTANTGISTVIDSRGRMLDSLPQNKVGVLYAQVQTIEQKSIYHQYPLAMILFSLAFVIVQYRHFNWKQVSSLWKRMKYAKYKI